MGELISDLFVSLDGYAHGVDAGPFFGYAGPELDQWIASELDKPQRLVLGRVTYEALAPISSGADQMSRRLSAVPKVVVSSTLSEPLEWANTELIRGDALDAIPGLKRESDVPLRTMGSISLVADLLASGHVDRLRLMVFPLTCGTTGREPIFAEHGPNRLDLAQSTVIDGRIVLLEYRAGA
jgi:dihydrofolate reductase